MELKVKTDTMQRAIECALLTNSQLTIAEMHYSSLNEISYTWVTPNSATVCIWHIKPKEAANAS